MRVTRRFWTVAAVGLALAGWGIITASPSLLVGAGILGAWIVSVQVLFLLDIEETRPHLAVTVDPGTERVTAEESTTAAVSASVDEPVPVSIGVRATTPVGVDGTIGTLVLDTGIQARRHDDLSWPVAGEFAFDPPRVTFYDRFGLFTQTLTHGERPTVVVEPRAPRTVHVGKGGDEVITGFGEHETGRRGSGLKAAEVREYVPGDAVKSIDWKATARLAETHVREFDVQTDRETNLFVDHRHSMGVGAAGETKLDYARQVVLAVLASARAQGDPVGCYTIGNEGVTAIHEPATTDERINAIRRQILHLEPTAAATGEPTAFSPAVARQRATTLADDESAFAELLRPYFTERTQYVRRVESQPLFTALTMSQSDQRQTAWSVLITDDTDHAELRESVRLAREEDAHVTLFLTPTVLFEEGALDDVEGAYDRYVEFESFRHELDSTQGVSAFELGPADRLSRILTARGTTAEARP